MVFFHIKLSQNSSFSQKISYKLFIFTTNKLSIVHKSQQMDFQFFIFTTGEPSILNFHNKWTLNRLFSQQVNPKSFIFTINKHSIGYIHNRWTLNRLASRLAKRRPDLFFKKSFAKTELYAACYHDKSARRNQFSQLMSTLPPILSSNQ